MNLKDETEYQHRLGRPWIIAFGVGLLIVVIASIIASPGTVPGWEQAIFHGINGLPDFLERPMWLFQLTGLVLVPAAIAVVAAGFRKYRLALGLLFLIPLKLLFERKVMKELVERKRPGTSICGGDTSCGHFRNVPMDSLSFVSGHAIVAWGIATLVWPYLPGRWKWLPVVIATLNSIARVYLGAHNPLDVIGGGALGVCIGVLLSAIVGVPARRKSATAEVAAATA